MMELKSLRTDPKKSIEGSWIDYIHGTRLLIARYDNKLMQTYKNGRILENGKLFNNMSENREEALRVSDQIDVECLASYVLLDWEGFSEDGEPIEYTPELGAKILADEYYTEFRSFVTRAALNTENYRVESEAAVAESVKDTAAS